jgi:hypothetical protein
MRCSWEVAHLGESRNPDGAWVRKPEGERQLDNVEVDGRIILYFKEMIWDGVDQIGWVL